MRAALSKPIGLFFYGLCYLVTTIAVLIWHPLINIILAASLIFVPAAVFLAITTQLIPAASSKKITAALTLWGLQSTGFILMLLVTTLWFARFPTYGNLNFSFSRHLSLSLIFSSFFLSTLLIMFCTLAQRRNRPISINLFFKEPSTEHYLAHFGNFWFFKATLLFSLFLLLLPCSLLLTHDKLNLIALLIASLFIYAGTKLPWCYQVLQIAIKRWQCSFATIVFAFFAAITLCDFFMTWLMKPLGNLALYNLSWIGSSTPLLFFWSLSIASVIPITYFIAPRIFTLTPLNIFLLSLTNPLLWLITLFDYQKNLLYTLQHLPPSVVNILSVIMIILSFLWLRSRQFAQLITLFFGNLGFKHQGTMPRNLVYRSLSILILIMMTLMLNAVFMLQIEFFLTAIAVLISCIIAVYLFLFRVPSYEH
jgi:hypothetical protein